MAARGIVARFALGAAGVRMGTAFLGCAEAFIADAWRKALRACATEANRVTGAVSGGAARAIRNHYIEEVEALGEQQLPYPAQCSVTKEQRAAISQRGDSDFMAMWAGQCVGLIRGRTAAEFVHDLVTELRQLRDKLEQR